MKIIGDGSEHSRSKQMKRGSASDSIECSYCMEHPTQGTIHALLASVFNMYSIVKSFIFSLYKYSVRQGPVLLMVQEIKELSLQ